VLQIRKHLKPSMPSIKSATNRDVSGNLDFQDLRLYFPKTQPIVKTELVPKLWQTEISHLGAMLGIPVSEG